MTLWPWLDTLKRDYLETKTARSLVTVATLSAVAQLALVARQVVTAAVFGTQSALDAAMLSFVLMDCCTTVFAGAIASAFLPRFVAVRERSGTAAAEKLLGLVSRWLTIAMATVAILLGILRHPAMQVLASSFDPRDLALAEQLIVWLLPGLLFTGLSTVWRAVLHTEQRFALATLSPGIVAMAAVLGLFLGAERWGIRALVVGVTVGQSLEALALGLGLRRFGWRVTRTSAELHPEVWLVAKQYVPMVAGALLGGAAPLVDSAMAGRLGTGSVAQLGYAGKVLAAPLGLIAVAVGTVTFPQYARLAARGEWAKLMHLRWRQGLPLLGLTVTAALVLLVGAPWIVRIFLERGQFSANDTREVTAVVRMLALQIPPYVLVIPGLRLLSSAGANQTILAVAAANLCTKVTLNIVLGRLIGLPGVALSTSLSALLAFGLVELSVRRLARPKDKP